MTDVEIGEFAGIIFIEHLENTEPDVLSSVLVCLDGHIVDSVDLMLSLEGMGAIVIDL